MTAKKRLPAVLLAFFCVCALSGCSVVNRVEYSFSGNEQTWESAAVEDGISSSVEEYYYDNLPDDLHEAYREIYVHLMRYEDSGEFLSPISVDDFWTVYYAVLADHPEIFWLGTSAQVEESALTGHVVAYAFDVTVPKEDRPDMRFEIEEAAARCIGDISPEASDYEKIKFVYEYIINTTNYDLNSADSQNIQSVLLYGSSVCAGYSKAFQYILHQMGMFCTYITGTIKDGGDHGWNMVRIDGDYYYVDVTWGDPLFAGNMDAFDTEDLITYTYLCCTSEDLFKTHTPDDMIYLPDCVSDRYDYYKLNGYFYDYFSYDTIYNAVMDSVWSGSTRIMMKFGTQEGYQEALNELFEGELLRDAGIYLMRENGVSTWNYRYHTDDNFNLITIYW